MPGIKRAIAAIDERLKTETDPDEIARLQQERTGLDADYTATLVMIDKLRE